MASQNLRPVFIKITVFHLAALFIIVMAVTKTPGVGEYFPVGTGENLLTAPESGGLTQPAYLDRIDGSPWSARLLFLILSFACSVGLSVPVAWTYMATRSPRKRDATFAQAIVLMPIAVTGLVLVVQNSLALAFALAGLVAGAGIRFRTNIREVVDTLFFLIAIGIGVASGVGSLGIALVTSIVFTYSLLITTALDFGGLSQASARKSKESKDSDAFDPDD
jgi:hypothetical protein